MRYFFIAYNSYGADGVFVSGNITYAHTQFPSRKVLIEKIMNINPEFKGVTITNIIELTESDYNDWTKNG